MLERYLDNPEKDEESPKKAEKLFRLINL